MLKSKDMQKGTIVEITAVNQMLYFGDLFNDAVVNYLQVGEKYELQDGVKKFGNSGLQLKLKQVDGGKEGKVFWVFSRDCMKIISQPTIDTSKVETHEDNEFKLNKNEEFVLVHKDHLDWVYSGSNDNERDKNDIVEGDLVFNTKSGQRKKFKTTQTLTGFLNSGSGALNYNYWRDKVAQENSVSVDQRTHNEQEYHLHALDNLPDWVGVKNFKNLEDLKKLELHKYNTDNRTISSEKVDFDCYEYVQNFIKTMHQTYLFGEAVSKLTTTLVASNQTDTHPFIFSSKFDISKYRYRHEIPKEKDIHLDLAFKELGWKKKDYPNYNQNGFVAIAFKTMQERDQFTQAYKNQEKVVKLLNVAEVLTHPELVIYQPQSQAGNKLKM